MGGENVNQFCGTPFWNDYLTWYTKSPRFTECFQNTVLVYIPCIFLWAFAGIDIYWNRARKADYIPIHWTFTYKVSLTAVLFFTRCVDFVIEMATKRPVFPVDIVTPLIQMITLVLCFILVRSHCIYGQRSSSLMFLYWFLVVLLDFPQVFTLIQGSINVHEFCMIVAYSISYFMFILTWIVDPPPDSSSNQATTLQRPSPEESTTFLDYMTFYWFNKIISQGYKNRLKIGDLWSVDYENSANRVSSLFIKHWKASVIKKNGLIFKNSVKYVKNDDNVEISGSEFEYNPSSIVPPLCWAFWPAFVPCSILMILQVLLSFVSPQILKYLILFLEGNDEIQWHGYFYASLLLLFSLLLMFSTSQYSKLAQIIGLRIKNALIIAIYRKALKLSNSSKKKTSDVEIGSLVSVDAQRFSHLINSLCKVWAFPLQLILATILLWQILGPSVLSGYSIMIFIVPIDRYLAKKTKELQTIHMNYHNRRIKIMNEIVSVIKVVKLNAWEPSFQERVLRLRNKEDTLLKKVAYLKALTSFLWLTSPFMVSLVTFGTYVLIDENNILDTSKAFVSLALFNIIRIPLVSFPSVFSSIMHARVSIERLNNFLNLEELDPNDVTHQKRDDRINNDFALKMQNCYFSWNHNEPSTLRNISLTVTRGSLIVVAGTVGCGKSSLISAFLGEMHKVSGEVIIKGSVAYLPRQAWINNCSFKSNILFGEQIDTEKYNRVIDLCDLRKDLKILPDGEETDIGDWEINLSVGLKQRISLARALYSDRDVYFFDTPLSALDIDVRDKIFEDAISSRGILKEKTRLYATHGVDYLAEADLIVFLNNGEISEMGNYDDLINRQGAFHAFVTEYGPEINFEDGDDAIAGPSRERSPIPDSSAELRKTPGQSRELSCSSSPEREEIKIEKLVKKEKPIVGHVKWKVYADYLKAIGLKMFSSVIFFLILHQIFSVGSNLWLSKWSSDKSIIINRAQDISKTRMYLGIYGLFGFAQTVSSFFFSMFWFIGAADASSLLHYLLLLNILHCPLAFFQSTSQDTIIDHFTKDIDILDNILPTNAKLLLSLIAAEAGTLLFMSYLTPIILTAIIPIGIVYYFIQRRYVSTSQQLKELESSTKWPLYVYFGTSITGASTIRAYQVKENFIGLAEVIVDYGQSCSYSRIIATRWLAIRLQFLGNLIVFFCALLSVILKDSLSPEMAALSITYALQVTETLTMCANASGDVEANIISVKNVKECAEIPQEADWETSELIPDDWPKNGNIEFIDYGMRYRNDLALVLYGINLSIEGGEKIGIVGRTGAGKSSITLGLFRLFEAAEGKIMIDGVDISKIGLHTLRYHLSIIPQDPVLISGTLKMNIDPLNRHTDEQIWNAIELAQLTPFVQGLSAGLQHKVTERGDNISVGQRQLICLCRAILRNSKILVLDEATAAIDNKTNELIQKTIRSAFAHCTVLTIAHRIKTILKSDRVIVMYNGTVAEFDKPSKLLMKKSSAFYRLAYSFSQRSVSQRNE